MKKTAAGMIFLLNLFIIGTYAYADPVISIQQYPKAVKASQEMEVLISWSEIPMDKGYILHVQLENWDVQPNVFFSQDVDEFSVAEEKSIKIQIPAGTAPAEGWRLVAVFYSKEKTWDDVLVRAETPKDIGIREVLEIKSYPKVVSPGTSVSLDISWMDIPLEKDLKLILQLENWDVTPGFFCDRVITDFKSTEARTITFQIPLNARILEGCRFVAAFISKTHDWNEKFVMASTQKDVVIK